MSWAARLSNYEIRAEGWKALTERLGVSGAIRVLMEYDPAAATTSRSGASCSATSRSTRPSRALGTRWRRRGRLGLDTIRAPG
jgi:hypothetical protein